MSRKLRAAAAVACIICLIFTAAIPAAWSSPAGNGSLEKNSMQTFFNEWPVGAADTPLAGSFTAEGITSPDEMDPDGPNSIGNMIASNVEADGIIVKYRDTAQQQARTTGREKRVSLPRGRELVLLLPDRGKDLQEQLAMLQGDPAVEYAELNYILSNQSPPNDPRYNDQWALNAMSAQAGWASFKTYLDTREARQITVAVLDTGIDGTHEDLAGRVTAGYDIINDSVLAPGAMSDDSYGSHGTMVAGIIAAATNNGTGIAGIAGDFPVSVMPVKVLDRAGYGTMLNIVNGIYWAVDNGADVINMSFGASLPDYPLALSEAVNYALNTGVTVIAAAGNEARYMSYSSGLIYAFYPAALDGVLGAAAYEKTGPSSYAMAPFSNTAWTYTGPCFLLPGVDVLTTQRDHAYGLFTGTSASAANLSGLAALLHSSTEPEDVPGRIIYALEKGTKSLSSLTLLDVYRAAYYLSRYSGPDPDDYPWVQFDYGLPETVTGTIRLPATVTDAPHLVDSVSFYYEAYQSDTPAPQLIATLPNNATGNRTKYEATWDTNGLPDGFYWVYVGIDSDGKFDDRDWQLYMSITKWPAA
jgi:subtilisin family serine protease